MHSSWVVQQSTAALPYCRTQRLLFIERLPYFQVILQSNFTISKEFRNLYEAEVIFTWFVFKILSCFFFFFLDMILYATISKINRVIRDASSVLILGFWVASGV